MFQKAFFEVNCRVLRVMGTTIDYFIVCEMVCQYHESTLIGDNKTQAQSLLWDRNIWMKCFKQSNDNSSFMHPKYRS